MIVLGLSFTSTQKTTNIHLAIVLIYSVQVRLYEKINKAFAPLEFFTTHQWRFISNNPIHLMEEMTTEDQEMFYFDVRKINWQNYFENYILGIRQIVFKEDFNTLPLARSNLKRYHFQNAYCNIAL
jgi:fatty acyl-CoA reductase